MSSCKHCAIECEPTGQQVVQVGGAHDYVVALAGNPNTGKSTVFNHLTGLRQHTGNWPGKTVARAEGTFVHDGKRFKLVDLPGTYSLLAQSADEEIARDYVLFGRPDCTVVVCDTTVLERNLHLVLQVLEITDKVVVCANLTDEAARKRIRLEARVLEKELGVPVVPTVARRGRGLDHLVRRIHQAASGCAGGNRRPLRLEPAVESAVAELAAILAEALPGIACPRWVAIRLLDGDERIEQALANGELSAIADRLSDPRAGEAAA